MIKSLKKIASKLLYKRIKKIMQRKAVFDTIEELIREYELIKQKKSNLSKKQRDEVVIKINELVDSGHIIASSNADIR